MSAVVELRGVRKTYEKFEALSGVDLSIERGELLALLGPNGAGKTTAISIMLGLRKPTTGTATMFGLDPADRRARSRCGVMLQESGVHGALKVRELIDLFRSYYPSPMPTARAIALGALESRAEVHASKLSGGEKQRLYFALAVCGDPELLFLDEPTVGMDVESRRAFLDGIREFARAGRTIVLTTHYLEEADALARRVVVISTGKVIADASPQEIKSRVPGKRVRFVTDGKFDATVLDGLAVQQLQQEDTKVRLYTSEPEAVVTALVRRNVVFRDLEVVGADLEEAFVALTSRSQAVKS